MDHYIFVSSHIGHFTPQLNVNKIASIITYFVYVGNKQLALE